MTGWTNEELDRIGLYVRSWRGESGAWYRGVQERRNADDDAPPRAATSEGSA